MKSMIAFVAAAAFSSIAWAGDCCLQEAAKAEPQAPKQQVAQINVAANQGTR
jgi:hypothetical protein